MLEVTQLKNVYITEVISINFPDDYFLCATQRIPDGGIAIFIGDIIKLRMKKKKKNGQDDVTVPLPRVGVTS